MSVTHPHTKIITKAAREILRPLGLAQKGRSRMWLDDRGWWLGLVEFQPSTWTRGSYLNVGINWLWSPKEYVSFDLGYRVWVAGDQFIEYESDEQFAPLAGKMVATAAERILLFREVFPSVESVATYAVRPDRRVKKVLLWETYCLQKNDAAIALGVVGDTTRARDLLEEERAAPEANRSRPRLDEPRLARVEELTTLLADSEAFRRRISSDVEHARALLRLEPWVVSFG